jgi:hypothetical protein
MECVARVVQVETVKDIKTECTLEVERERISVQGQPRQS